MLRQFDGTVVDSHRQPPGERLVEGLWLAEPFQPDMKHTSGTGSWQGAGANIFFVPAPLVRYSVIKKGEERVAPSSPWHAGRLLRAGNKLLNGGTD